MNAQVNIGSSSLQMEVPVEENRKSGYEKIDSHVHIPGNKALPSAVLRGANIRHVVNISYSRLSTPQDVLDYEESLKHDVVSEENTYLLCTAFSVSDYDTPGYADRVIQKLKKDFDSGAVAVKIWKDIGMMLKDTTDNYVFCDDHRFAPIFQWLDDRKATVFFHAADPIDAWLPLNPASPHFKYYSAFPEFHWYNKPGKPSYEELMQHRDNVLGKYTSTRFIAAHLANMSHDVGLISAFLDKFPHVVVDTAARQADIMLQPHEKVRELFMRFPERILYGTDWSPNDETFGSDPTLWNEKTTEIAGYFQYSYKYFEEDLALPAEVLSKFYFDNSAKLFNLVL